LLLLGFAATDFVMIKTLSLADAAEHVIRNDYPPWHAWLQSVAQGSQGLSAELFGELFTDYFNKQLVATVLLGALGCVFWFMRRKASKSKIAAVAVPIVVLYLPLNALVIGSALVYLAAHPERLHAWWSQVAAGDWRLAQEAPLPGSGWLTIVALCLLFLPQLSLGLSGFEMSLIVMPQVLRAAGDDPQFPQARILTP